MASIAATDFRKHQKPHHTDRNRRCPTHAPDRTQLRDGSSGRRQAGAANSTGHAKAHPFRCAGVPGRPERFRRRHPKAHPDFGVTRSMIRDWNDFVRLGGTSVPDSDPLICSRLTELMAKNS
nr:hypothetical protein GZ27A8_9 [uncultured archaeon GZfos27A8]